MIGAWMSNGGVVWAFAERGLTKNMAWCGVIELESHLVDYFELEDELSDGEYASQWLSREGKSSWDRIGRSSAPRDDLTQR